MEFLKKYTNPAFGFFVFVFCFFLATPALCTYASGPNCRLENLY